MPTVTDNKAAWDGGYHWYDRGEEWSVAWGNPSMQWYGAILPRIRTHVPADTIVEIACGYGRWTTYLLPLCKRLMAVDLSKECIDACRRRFSKDRHAEFLLNDGLSLPGVEDASVDFVFSFDSLVHADQSVLSAYIREFARVLKPDGVAFIHHSNRGEYENFLGRLRARLEKSRHGRDRSVDARLIQKMAREAGLSCAQEIVPWVSTRMFIDCMSTITKKNPDNSGRVFRNGQFMREAENLRRLAQFY